MKKINIAIDGYSACGKSSTAKKVAQKFKYDFIDSGAMYRAVTLFFLKEHINLQKTVDLVEALDKCHISFDGLSVLLNDEKVDDAIRYVEINERVSRISAISEVRRKMVTQQQKIGENKGVVMDGRDIGTVVFPSAELKVFMTAEIEVRAKRRREELKTKGMNDTVANITRNLLERDRRDSTRDDSPLRMANNAIEIDTTHLTLDEQINQVVALAKKIIHAD